jgi:hypothetical protein
MWYRDIVASTKEKTLIGRISDIVRSGRGSNLLAWKELEKCDGCAV